MNDDSSSPVATAAADAPALERKVQAPAGVQGSGPGEEKRRWPRAPVELAVRMRFESVREFLDATAEDLSVGGMFLRSHHFGPGGELREVGQLLALQFDAGSRRVVEGLGKVVRVISPGTPGVEPGVGVEFVELDASGRKLIEAIVQLKLAGTFGG